MNQKNGERWSAARAYVEPIRDQGNVSIRTNTLVEKLTAIVGVKKAFTATHFHETVLQLEQSATGVLKALMEKGILGGFDLSQDYPELGEAILVCTTEMRTEEEIDLYVDAMREVLTSGTAVASLAESA